MADLKCYKRISDVLCRLVQQQIEEAQRRIIREGCGTEGKYRVGSFEFIPSSLSSTINTFMAINKYLRREEGWMSKQEKKFLDAGCGIGNVMLFAKIIGPYTHVHGLELFDDTIKEGKKFLANYGYDQHNRIKIIKADVLRYNDYGNYDFIYYYQPLHNWNLEEKFEKRVEDQMKVGAFLYPRGLGRNRLMCGPRFEKITLIHTGENEYQFEIYKKISM